MTNLIIPILNIRLLTTNYFSELFELCELFEDDNGTHPLQYCSNGEKKHVTNFDTSNGLCYWRKTGAITSQDLDSGLVSSNKYVRITIPLRLVAVVKRSMMNVDNAYNAELLGNDLFKVLNQNLNGSIRSTIGARQIGLSIESIEDNKQDILDTELKKANTLSDDYVICAINLSVLIDIQQRCIDSSCNLLTDCEALIASLSAFQKNACLLPNYDFSDTTVTDNLTDGQQEALIELLCTASNPVIIENSDASYTATATCGTTFVLPDTTYNVYVESVLQTTQTVPTLKDETINIIWT